jgi:hypothetical protein
VKKTVIWIVIVALIIGAAIGAWMLYQHLNNQHKNAPEGQDGDFQIWQRGESFANVANKYTADRWMIKNAVSATSLVEKSVASPNGEPMCQSMHIKDTTNENTYLAYNFETAIKGTYTLSFWYFSTTPISTYIHDNGSYVKLMYLQASSV